MGIFDWIDQGSPLSGVPAWFRAYDGSQGLDQGGQPGPIPDWLARVLAQSGMQMPAPGAAPMQVAPGPTEYAGQGMFPGSEATDFSAARRMAPPVPAGASAQGAPMTTGLSPIPTGGSFLDRLQAGLGEHSNQLFAFAGGTLRGGMGKGLEDASKIGLYEDAQNYQRKMAAGAVTAVYQSLLARGVPQAQAIAAASNPEILKAELERLNPKYSPHVVDGTLTSFNPNSGAFAVQGAVPKLEKLGPGDTLQAVTAPVGGRPGTATQVATGGPEKPPPGFDYVDKNDPSKGLVATPGGPATQLSSEAAGRLALVEASKPGLDAAKKFYLGPAYKSSPSNTIGIAATQALGVGEAGRARRGVEMAVEAALRTATGANASTLR